MKAVYTKGISNTGNWVFTCDCESVVQWTAWLDNNFWQVRSKTRTWSVRTCKCMTLYKLNPETNEVTETV